MKPSARLVQVLVLATAVLEWPGGARAQSQLYSFTTIAGDAGYGSTDGTNPAVGFWRPNGVALDNGGQVYVADTDNQTIRKLRLVGTNWVSTTIAGLAGMVGSADGTNSGVRFNQPYSVAVDGNGALFVADYGNNTIRQLAPVGTDWVCQTIAGAAGSPGSRDGTNSSARLFHPSGITVDGAGNVYVADSTNNTIRQLTRLGADWVSHTIAGKAGSVGSIDGTNTTARFSNPQGVTADASGNLYVADTGGRTIRKLTLSGTNWVSSTLAGTNTVGGRDGTNSAIRFFAPTGVAVNTAADVFVVDGGRVRKLRQTGTNWISSTIAGSGNSGTTDGTNTAVQFFQPYGIAAGRNGTLYVADTWNNSIRQLLPSGTNWVSSTIGSPAHWGVRTADGTNSNSLFDGPFGVASDNSGNVIVVDSYNDTIRKLTRLATDWVSSTLAGLPGSTGSADGTNADVRFNVPYGAAVDRNGNIYVADSYNHTIRKLTQVGTNWVSSTIAGKQGIPGGADGTNSTTRFSYPACAALDGKGNLYVTDTYTVRKLSAVGPDWVSSTIAGRFGSYGSLDGANGATRFYELWGIAVDNAGNVYVADSGNDTIRKITPIGTNWVVSTIAGRAGAAGAVDGTNAAARFYGPAGVAVDNAGNVYVAENENNLIRKLTPVGTNWVVRTIGGLAGAAGYADGINDAARFNTPSGIAVDSAGNLYVAEMINNNIRQGMPLIVTPRCRDVIVSAGTNCLADASVDNGSFSSAGNPVTVHQLPSGPYPLGTNLVTLIASDNYGDSNSCTAQVIVLDTTPPELVCPSNLTVEFTSSAGAEVFFTPHAIDFCSLPVAVTCAPEAGSTLPIGTTEVRCSAADAVGNSASCAFQVTVLGPQGVLSNVLAQLTALGDTVASPRARKALNEAISSLTISLAGALWIDQTHLARSHGETMFNENKAAVQALSALTRPDRDTLPPAVLQTFIDRILKADRLLAAIAIQDDANAGVRPKPLSEARHALALGDEEVLLAKYEAGINHYRNAWHQSSRLMVNLAGHLDAGGSLRLEFTAFPGETYGLETSTNLINWSSVGTVTVGPDGFGRFEVVPGSGTSNSGFYRARALP